MMTEFSITYIDGFLQNCCNSRALEVELLQSWTKQSICIIRRQYVEFAYKDVGLII